MKRDGVGAAGDGGRPWTEAEWERFIREQDQLGTPRPTWDSGDLETLRELGLRATDSVAPRDEPQAECATQIRFIPAFRLARDFATEVDSLSQALRLGATWESLHAEAQRVAFHIASGHGLGYEDSHSAATSSSAAMRCMASSAASRCCGCCRPPLRGPRSRACSARPCSFGRPCRSASPPCGPASGGTTPGRPATDSSPAFELVGRPRPALPTPLSPTVRRPIMVPEKTMGYPIQRLRRLGGRRACGGWCARHACGRPVRLPHLRHRRRAPAQRDSLDAGQYRWSLDRLPELVEQVVTAGVPAVLLFGLPPEKDLAATGRGTSMASSRKPRGESSIRRRNSW